VAAPRYRRVGIFVSLIVVLGGVTSFFIGGSSELFESRYTLNASWSDIAGLKEGAVVRLAGWDVGEVTQISFSHDLNTRLINVEMRVLKEYQDRIRQCPERSRSEPVSGEGDLGDTLTQLAPSSRARIETMGVLGDKYVALTMGPTHDAGHKTADHPDGVPCGVIMDGKAIETDKSVDIVEYTKRVTEILNSTASIGSKVDLLLGNNQEAAQANLSGSFAHLEDVLHNAREGEGLLHALIYDETMPRRVNSILANLERTSTGLVDITQEIRQGDGIAHELVYGANGEELAVKLRQLAGALSKLTEDIQNEESLVHTLIYDEEKVQLVEDLTETAASLRRTTAMIEAGEGTIGMMARDPALYEDIRSLVRGAHRNKLLRAYIRQTVQRGEEQDAEAWQPVE
jgi:phospholipid/cholesterol/gamma-HCH transport system substrate-binding protein